MKINILSVVLVLIVACKSKNEASQSKEDVETPAVTAPTAAAPSFKAIIGSFVGAFGDNKITFLIAKMTNDSVFGSSVVGGNNRPFIGIVKFAEGTYNIEAKEPGDEKDDGKFMVTLKDSSSVSGSWTNYKDAAKTKTFSLQRKAFVYDISVGEYPQASSRLLKEEDVVDVAGYDLSYMRNEIFARHGYCFKKKDLRRDFEGKEWYVPNNTDVSGLLTEIEKANIKLIKRYEKYYDETADEFGR